MDRGSDDPEVVATVPAAPPAALQLAEQIEARMKRRDAQGLSVPSIARLEARRDRMIAEGDPRAETMGAALVILKARADAGGLPAPRTQRQVNREQWRARVAALPPEERQMIEARREWRRQQRMAASAQSAPAGESAAPVTADPAPVLGHFRERWANMTPEQRAEWRAKRAAREAMMTPEERQRLEERRAARRQQMLRAHEGLTGGPEPAPQETDAPQ